LYDTSQPGRHEVEVRLTGSVKGAGAATFDVQSDIV
jgi:hypothetical protein